MMQLLLRYVYLFSFLLNLCFDKLYWPAVVYMLVALVKLVFGFWNNEGWMKRFSNLTLNTITVVDLEIYVYIVLFLRAYMETFQLMLQM